MKQQNNKRATRTGRVEEDRGAPFGALKKEVKQEVINLYHHFPRNKVI